ncbi:hypothetical protein [Embleya sp. NBC_00896]|uniref:hypothetical protein n=1 Tax=Embleya sp. NBC_00896 TaxID=2975961 RepID=UPI002F9123E7|nr:hypothetical protein OG928_35800 [Embleya sp. NBC_00896]
MSEGWGPLSDDVRRTLELLLAGDTDADRGYRPQIPHTRMKSGCTCGCPSVDLRVDRDTVAAGPVAGSPIVADGIIRHDGGEFIGEALVFAFGGYLTTLEVCVWDDVGVLEPPLWERLSV